MRLSVTFGFRVSWHAYRPHPAFASLRSPFGRPAAGYLHFVPVLPVCVPTVVAFATDFFRARFLAEPALFFTTVAVTASGHFLISFFSDLFMPMPGTLKELGPSFFCLLLTADLGGV